MTDGAAVVLVVDGRTVVVVPKVLVVVLAVVVVVELLTSVTVTLTFFSSSSSKRLEMPSKTDSSGRWVQVSLADDTLFMLSVAGTEMLLSLALVPLKPSWTDPCGVTPPTVGSSIVCRTKDTS